MIKVIVFDFDGVLVDSNILKETDAWDAVFPDAGDRMLLREARKEIKETRFNILAEFARRKSIPEEKRARFVDEYAAQYNAAVQKGIVQIGLVPKARETLAQLRTRFILYINSATPEPALRESANRLNIAQFFQGIFGKPLGKREILEKISVDERAQPEEMLFVGDGEFDYQAARDFGCVFLGVANQYNQWERETRFPVISNLSSLPDSVN